MTFWFRRYDTDVLRLGVVAGARTGKAVQRNRARRLLREAFRLNREKLHGNGDIVLSARSSICDTTYGEVSRELLELARRAGLYGDRAGSDPRKGHARQASSKDRI
jgi:ribonuclease P protein component